MAVEKHAVETQTTAVSLAFPDGKQYVIPSYQRNYVWNREDQWEPLWDDLRTLTEHRLDSSDTRQHFLGTIITKQIGTQGFIERWCVIDGQQRLTTLQILMTAMRSACDERALDQYASLLKNHLVNSRDRLREDSDKYKIQHKSIDYRGFSAIIKASVEGVDFVEQEMHRLDTCHDYFRSSVAEWLAKKSDTPPHRRAEVLTSTILQKFYVVDIRLDRSENSHTIFEALNARAEPLTEWEKIKNYILSIAASKEDPDGDSTYKEHLDEYDSDRYWEELVSEQRFSGKRIEYFLFFFAQIELPKHRKQLSGKPLMDTLSRNRLYREFRHAGEHVYRRSSEELQGLLRRLARYAKIFRKLTEASSDTFSEYALLVMYRRRKLRLASLIPVLMVLVEKLGCGEDFDRALRIIDSYLMRRVAVKARYSGFDDVAFRIVQTLTATDPGKIGAVLIQQFEKAMTKTSRWPSDLEVSNSLREADMYNRCANNSLLLSGIAQKMHDERGGELTMHFSPKAELTVEHVAPQKWQRHWKDDLDFGDSDEERRRLDRFVHRIGNLTLVTRKLNPKLGDRPWPYKAELLGADNLEMNRRLLDDMEGETWNQAEIDRRSRIVADYVNEIWPHAAALRQELGIAAPVEDAADHVSGIPSEVARHLVESVTETGMEEGWANTDRLNRARRRGRYGRHLRLGGGSRWQSYWFGVSTKDRHLVVEPQYSNNHHFIQIPKDRNFDDSRDLDDILESTTTQVRHIAESIASGSDTGADQP